MFDLLILLLIANGAPILARNIFGSWLATPVDFNYRFIDQKLIFGPAKTWRGIFVSIFFTVIVGILLGYEVTTGLTISSLAMAGDLLSSFTKRRLSVEPSGQLVLVDQIPESALPVLFVYPVFGLQLFDVIIVLTLFTILELLLSKILFTIGIRKRPY